MLTLSDPFNLARRCLRINYKQNLSTAYLPETGELVLRPFEDDIFSKGGQRLRLFYDILKRTIQS
jgi:hypothetical protein